MGLSLTRVGNFFEGWGGWGSPFTAPVPNGVRDVTLRLQSQRLHANLPLLCLTIAACAVAMGVAVLGDLPWWQQLTPPLVIVGTSLGLLIRSRVRGRPQQLQAIQRELRTTFWLTTCLGLLAGAWCVNAFVETEKYYCMVAPVFIGIVALVGASCLLSVPRAAIAGIFATTTPIAIKLALYDNVGLRGMAAMLLVVGIMQSGMVIAKFRETVETLTLQDELNRLAGTDALTGLDNRLSFMRKFEQELSAGHRLLVALGDLDGFKQINDQHGHAAGDTVLVAISERLRTLAITAISVARLGGDEFALLYRISTSTDQALTEIKSMPAMIALPISLGDDLVQVGMSLGHAASPDDANTSKLLLAMADMRLYLDKANRRGVHKLPDHGQRDETKRPRNSLAGHFQPL